MQTISENKITQGEHGQFHAVDIGPSPDIFYYAPEDGTITGVGDSGTCGFRLGMNGATGAHGFCHNEEIYVTVGQKVRRGQKLAKMGYTGYTIPAGPQGRHVHWVILRNGVYVYPPNLVDEPFKKGEAEMPITQTQLDKLIKMSLNREPTAQELSNQDWMNNPGLAIDTFWENGGKQGYPPKPQGVKPYSGPELFVKE